jgi:hypothetical protein
LVLYIFSLSHRCLYLGYATTLNRKTNKQNKTYGTQKSKGLPKRHCVVNNINEYEATTACP